MKQEFWHNAWNSSKTGWQQKKVNSRLQSFWPALQVAPGVSSQGSVFVPLCGSSVDLLWLLDQGLHVTGCELSEIAVKAFFSNPDLGSNQDYEVKQVGSCKVYSAASITICCGDYFTLDTEALNLPPLNAAYDRAALVAMPAEMRVAYVQKLHQLLQPGAPVLLIGFSYNQQKMNGPPFSVTDAEVSELYSEGFTVETLGQNSGPEILGNLAERGLDTMTETVYLIRRL